MQAEFSASSSSSSRESSPREHFQPSDASKSVHVPKTETPLAQRAPSSPSNLRLLLTEDNVVNQRVVLALLERLGIKADVANNGAAAVAAVEQKHALGIPYDVVLMDIQMPVMSGIEAASRIRDLKLAHPPIVIALTAATTVLDKERCLEIMDDYLSKPLALKSLRASLDRNLVARGLPGLPEISTKVPPPTRSSSSPRSSSTIARDASVEAGLRKQLLFYQALAGVLASILLAVLLR